MNIYSAADGSSGDCFRSWTFGLRLRIALGTNCRLFKLFLAASKPSRCNASKASSGACYRNFPSIETGITPSQQPTEHLHIHSSSFTVQIPSSSRRKVQHVPTLAIMPPVFDTNHLLFCVLSSSSPLLRSTLNSETKLACLCAGFGTTRPRPPGASAPACACPTPGAVSPDASFLLP